MAFSIVFTYLDALRADKLQNADIVSLADMALPGAVKEQEHENTGSYKTFLEKSKHLLLLKEVRSVQRALSERCTASSRTSFNAEL